MCVSDAAGGAPYLRKVPAQEAELVQRKVRIAAHHREQAQAAALHLPQVAREAIQRQQVVQAQAPQARVGDAQRNVN